ncbi:MAG: peptidylprolyl isomerase [Nitrospirota bacterium]|nr:peptidylprolyl isomerase [Nitrospirota bacterium]MDH5586097.1 peptidylprolyl isomerase [Nitrospirota bacterium]MDH5775285.1 peptidylprolyl isomerase [Nitrospirota bacterium]
MALLIGKNSVVSVNYTLTDDAGKVLDSSDGSKPMLYLHGSGQIVPGLEKALEGKGEGDALKVRVEPAEAYGEVIPNGVKTIERAAFEGVDVVEVGMAFEAQAPDGSAQHIMVTKVEGDNVTIDINHPLAGVALNFDVKIVSVRAATKEELEHGHSHEGDGHSH